MYLYYDKMKTLKTVISHGEPIRQNSDTNIFICLDYDFFSILGEFDEEKIKLSEFYASITYENGEYGADGIASGTPKLLPFEKLNSNELTYHLFEEENYWTYHFKFDYKQISLYPGNINFNVELIYNNERHIFSAATLFVEARTGLPETDGSITQAQYDDINMRINLISNRVTVLENKNSENSEEINLILQNYYNRDETNEIFATKEQLENEINNLGSNMSDIKIATEEDIENLFK